MQHILVSTLACLAAASVSGAEPKFQFFQPLDPPRSFAVMAHRGLAVAAPENTRRAIEMCVVDGLEWVQVDVRLTKDGKHVLFREAMLEGKTDATGPLNERTLEELKQLDAGAWFARHFTGLRIMTLDECLALAKGKINLCLDCHAIDPAQLVQQIQSAGLERQVLVRADRDTLGRVREVSQGTIALMPVWNASDGIGSGLDELAPAAVEVDAAQITPEIAKQFHDRGIRVHASALNQADNPSSWDTALAAGADCVLSDKCEELIAHVLDRQLQSRPVRFACHRGASRYAPENTLPAFEKAYRLHADFVEFDVRPSRDGDFFLLHDANLNRTTNGQGPIRDATTATIEGLDAGSSFGQPFSGTHVPSLEQFLSAVPEGANLYFDAKDIPPQALAAAINKHQLAERTIVYQSAAYLLELKQIDPRIRAMPPAGTLAEVNRLAASLQPYAVDTRWTVLSKEYIDHCHQAGIKVFSDAPGPVSVKGYRQAIEWGIDLIQTDFPLRAWRAMELVAAGRATR